MTSAPRLETGQTALVASSPDEAPRRMVVDLVQEGHVTLASVDNVRLPVEWKHLTEVHLTCLDRFSVYELHVPVVRCGATRLVIGEPDDSTPVQRRAYARVLTPLPASCMLLDPVQNRWTPFDATVRDLGGGGLALTADAIAPEGAVLVVSLAIPGDHPAVTVGRVLPSEFGPGIGRPTVRVEFSLIREPDRDRIMRFVLLSLAGHRPGAGDEPEL